MSHVVNVSKLAELLQSLPSQIGAAACAVADAEQRLARILTLRAAGQPVKASDVSVARMALCRALRDAEDLRRIESALPAMLEPVRDATRPERMRAAQQAWSGVRDVQCA